MSKKSKSPMTPTAASRIQSHADRTSSNPGFKSRAQSTAANNTAGASKGGKGSSSGGGKKR